MKKGEKRKQAKALARRTERKEAKKSSRTAAAGAELRLLRQARNYPLEGCWVQSGWQESGLAVVVVARRQPNGLLVFGNFLVDHFCLGVKNCFVQDDVSPGLFYARLPEMLPKGKPTALEPALAHELVYGSIEYAARLGFRPHRDFAVAQQVLDPPDAHPRTGAVTFGKDGKPFYVSGPYDNVNAIMNTLMRAAGPGNFDYLAHIENPPDELIAAFNHAEETPDDIEEEDDGR